MQKIIISGECFKGEIEIDDEHIYKDGYVSSYNASDNISVEEQRVDLLVSVDDTLYRFYKYPLSFLKDIDAILWNFGCDYCYGPLKNVKRIISVSRAEKTKNAQEVWDWYNYT